MRHDAVVIGAGINGLACAIALADRGWDVVVVERNDEPGGAVRTADVTLPGYSHDLMATNLNLFAGSPFFTEFGERLRRHGLEFAPTASSFSSIFPDGRFIGVSTDAEATVDGIAAISEADAVAWRRLADQFADWSPHLFELLGTPLPSSSAARHLIGGMRSQGARWPLDVGRLALQSTREFTTEHFESAELRALVAAWGMHLDFGPDVAGGALFPFLETFANAANGMVLGRGGARTMIDAMVALLESLGGQVRCGAEVASIELGGGGAAGVRLTTGELVTAGRAVVANVTPDVLFTRLVPERAIDARFAARVAGFSRGPGAMMIHLAMDGLPQWVDPAAAEYAYVHIGPYVDDMASSYQQAVAGLLPTRPTLAVGQPTVVDPTRAPHGKHVLWLQVRMVPSQIVGDAGDEIEARTWVDAAEPFADRVMSILEHSAPGVGDLVLGRHVMSPDDLEAINPNLVGGDSVGGSHHPMQHYVLRPFPGWSRYSTPIERLYMCGAGTWPGAGVGAGSGHLLARQLSRGPRLLRRR